MKPDELTEIVTYLQQFDFKTETAAEQKNRTHYFDFLNQVILWRNESAPDGSSVNGKGKLKTLDELRIKVAEHIRKNSAFSDKVKGKKIEKIGNKILQLESKLDPVLLAAAMARYDFNDPLLLDSIVYYFDRLPMPLVVAMAKNVVK